MKEVALLYGTVEKGHALVFHYPGFHTPYHVVVTRRIEHFETSPKVTVMLHNSLNIPEFIYYYTH